jgi:hypothetical protein
MAMGVDLNNTLIYKDINNLPAVTQQIIAYQFKQGYLTALDVLLNANSGFNNMISSYQNMRYAQSMVANTIQTAFSNLQFTSDSNAPLFNYDLQSDLQRGPVRFGPIDVGNVHTNYEQASYQNMRYRNLFNMGMDILIPNQTTLQLMQQINMTIPTEDNSIDQVNSGTYTISGRSIYIQAAKYFEKLGVVRHGTNAPYVQG